ncbi:STAS domain-containing protein [Streptomyces sp. NPDC016845]|uniref:STAS domain-containing protein n=1 Tax=Streptomyces sp. NPDC016845 TaxID=3364972 RepID=UPI0037A0AA38
MDTTPPLSWEICVIDTGDTVLLHVRGELDLATAPELEALLARLTSRRCELDLSHVPFIDSTGINLLTRHHRLAQKTGGHLRVVAVTRAVRRVLDITGTSTLLLSEPGTPRPKTTPISRRTAVLPGPASSSSFRPA